MGADPNMDMNGCNAPLFVAVTMQSGIDIVRALVDYGAKFDKTDCTGTTPVQFAQDTKKMQPEVAEFLSDAATGRYAVTGMPMAAQNAFVGECSCCASDYVMNMPSIRVDSHQNLLRFEYTQDDPDVSALLLNFNINKPLQGVQSGDISVLLKPIANEGIENSMAKFRYTSDFPLEYGDTLHYWVLAIVDKRGFTQITDQKWTYGGSDKDNQFSIDLLPRHFPFNISKRNSSTTSNIKTTTMPAYVNTMVTVADVENVTTSTNDN